MEFFIRPLGRANKELRQRKGTDWQGDIGDFYRPSGLLHYLYTISPELHLAKIVVRSERKLLFQLSVSPTRPLRKGEGPPHHSKVRRSEYFSSLLRVAQPLIGTPLIWGHNRGRGDLGFDPYTFALNVYQQALNMPVAEARQILYAGQAVNFDISSILPGDLLVFSKGKHVGIYIGAGQMLCAGGGNHKVGYQSLSRGKFRYHDLTMVRRLF